MTNDSSIAVRVPSGSAGMVWVRCIDRPSANENKIVLGGCPSWMIPKPVRPSGSTTAVITVPESVPVEPPHPAAGALDDHASRGPADTCLCGNRGVFGETWVRS